jgi:stage II sporulation protein AA (anti-sigma F factor antagonist)
MNVNFDLQKNVLIIQPVCDLDHHHVEQLREVIDYNIGKKEVHHILFDLSEVSFADSSGIGLILGRYKKIGEKKGQAGFINVLESVKAVLKISGVFLLAKEYKNQKAAVEALSKGGRK